MKKEFNLLLFSLFSNITTSVVKIVGGFLFGMPSLVADGFHTFSDFISDIMAIIGLILSRKHPTKENPWGFGRVQYLTNLFIGILLFLLGIVLIVVCFFVEAKIPTINVLYVLMIAILIKTFTILYLDKKSKRIKTHNLRVSIDESKSDLVSSICISGIAICLILSKYVEILKYTDLIGSLILSYLVAKAGFNIIKENSFNLLGTVDIEDDKIEIVKKIIKDCADVEVENIELIKYSSYYKIHFVLILDPNLTLRQIQKIEDKIILALKRNRKINIKHVNIDVDPNK